MQYSNFAISRQTKKAIEKLHALACSAQCLSQKRMCKFSRILSLSALHIASGFFLFIAPAPTLHAQTDSHSQSPDQTEPKLGAYSFSIPAQNANEALTELAKQANTTLLFPFDLAKKVKTLAKIREAEGYMAEVEQVEGGFLLHENHCPICVAATSCQGFCKSELRLFQEVLGEQAEVKRESHIVSGARRCTYRIVEKAS